MKMLNPKRTVRLVAFTIAVATGLSGAVQATTTASEAAASGSWKVESGQWLGRIVAALESNPAKRLQLMEQIVFQNPQAFINADPNRMLAGAELSLPGATVVAKTSPSPGSELVAPKTAIKETISEAQKIGRITSVRGQLTATGKNGQVRALRRRSYVQQGDTLSTGAKGGAQMKFNDGAQIALRRDSTLRIDEYRWKGEQDGEEKAVMSLVKGGFRTITGAIGKLNKANYRVHSPFATIGIRGTHYALMSCQGGSCGEMSGGKAPQDGLYGGTAFGAIIVDDSHVIEPQQYFYHDGSSFRELMGPPGFLFGSDTQVGDSSGTANRARAPGQSAGDAKASDSSGNGFAVSGGAETGGIIANTQQALPGQEGEGVFTEGEEETAEDFVGSSGESILVGVFDPATLDLTGNLTGLGGEIALLLANLGATNVAEAASGALAYTAHVFPFEGLFEASDDIVDGFTGDEFLFFGDFGGKSNVLLSMLSDDGGDLGFFFGPTGAPIATQTVTGTGFTAHIGRWDSNVVSRFFEPSEGGTQTGADFPLATEFGFSLNRTSDIQLAGLTGLGTLAFDSQAGFGSDELGQGFTVNQSEMSFAVDFFNQEVVFASINVLDAQLRNWDFFGSGLNIPLRNDVRIDLSGSCTGCASGSSAEAFMFATFLGPQAQGALGSFGAQTGTLSADAQEAIAGVVVYQGFNP